MHENINDTIATGTISRWRIANRGGDSVESRIDQHLATSHTRIGISGMRWWDPAPFLAANGNVTTMAAASAAVVHHQSRVARESAERFDQSEGRPRMSKMPAIHPANSSVSNT